MIQKPRYWNTSGRPPLSSDSPEGSWNVIIHKLRKDRRVGAGMDPEYPSWGSDRSSGGCVIRWYAYHTKFHLYLTEHLLMFLRWFDRFSQGINAKSPPRVTSLSYFWILFVFMRLFYTAQSADWGEGVAYVIRCPRIYSRTFLIPLSRNLGHWLSQEWILREPVVKGLNRTPVTPGGSIPGNQGFRNMRTITIRIDDKIQSSNT